MFFSLGIMDVNGAATEGKSSVNSSSTGGKRSTSDTFINHAAISWHENRKKWVGDQSKRSNRVPKDPIISWSMDYEDLLSTHDPFPESIPLAEMVDFLVDIWYDDGLFD